MLDPLQGLREALIDRYVIDREIGHGASATVYLARDQKLRRTVAIKVLRPEFSLAVSTERFLRGIEIAARLQHPHLLSVHDAGQANNLLYCVLPYITGETLRDRLAREGRLPVADAVRFAGEIAGALSYAHDQGVIHRDIKPANILLSAGHAVVVDFGIARAIREAESGDLTQTGVALGTPAYMSPEQASGEPLDGRSDIYSLGCVVYEMLAGTAPFSGPTSQALLAQHLVDPVPPLRRVRPEVPKHVERAVERALAKSPGERFATADQFAAALQGRSPGPSPLPGPIRRRAYRTLAAIALVAAIAFGLRATLRGSAGAARPGLDTLRYLVLPFSYEGVARDRMNAEQLLLDALGRWDGIALTDPFRVREALAQRNAAEMTMEDAQRVAVQLGAGRYARGEVSRVGDSLRVHVGLYDAMKARSPLSEATVKLGVSLAHADSEFDQLADRVLFTNAAPSGLADSKPVTKSFPARQHYARGLENVGQWDLAGADSEFRLASNHDPRFAQALLWLAQVRFWSDMPVATWASASERAARERGRLPVADRPLLDALTTYARGDLNPPCVSWMRLAENASYDFRSWYGSALCLSRDSVVVGDANSPSGWRFRSSYHRALKAYERAFRLFPPLHVAFHGGGYRSLRHLLMTDGNNARWGRALAPDTSRFGALADWRGDSLLLVPYPIEDFQKGAESPGQRQDRAMFHERQLLYDITVAWLAAMPQNSDAMQAMALALELLGDPSALDSLHRARALATQPEERTRVAANEVWLRLKFSIPGRPAGVRAARALADSLLAVPPSERARAAASLVGLAALTGRGTLAASLVREPAAAPEYGAVPALNQDAPPLLVFAALGGPGDSIAVLEERVERAIAQSLPPEMRTTARMEWLARAAGIAFPDYQLHSLTSPWGKADDLVAAQAAWLQHDTASVRKYFQESTGYRQRHLAAVGPDYLYPEGALLAAMGDQRGAVAWIDPVLSAIAAAPPGMLADPARAATLVRTLALRADLARARGDRAGARSWAQNVVILWSDADPFLQPLVSRMRRVDR